MAKATCFKLFIDCVLRAESRACSRGALTAAASLSSAAVLLSKARSSRSPSTLGVRSGATWSSCGTTLRISSCRPASRRTSAHFPRRASAAAASCDWMTACSAGRGGRSIATAAQEIPLGQNAAWAAADLLGQLRHELFDDPAGVGGRNQHRLDRPLAGRLESRGQFRPLRQRGSRKAGCRSGASESRGHRRSAALSSAGISSAARTAFSSPVAESGKIASTLGKGPGPSNETVQKASLAPARRRAWTSLSIRLPASDCGAALQVGASGINRASVSTNGTADTRERSMCATATVISSTYGATALVLASASDCPSARSRDGMVRRARKNRHWIDSFMIGILSTSKVRFVTLFVCVVQRDCESPGPGDGTGFAAQVGFVTVATIGEWLAVVGIDGDRHIGDLIKPIGQPAISGRIVPQGLENCATGQHTS